jgi:adenylate cyclase
MSAVDRDHSRLRRLTRRFARLGVSLSIAFAVVGACIVVRGRGWLEKLELLASDQIVRMAPRESQPAAPILLVLVDESDIDALQQYPISDAYLADLLNRLLQFHPAAIGVDLFRNIPVVYITHDDGPQRLATVMLNHGNIIWAYKYKGVGTGIPPPTPLRGKPQRLGFVDVEPDTDGEVRRMILQIETPDRRMLPSFDLRLCGVSLRSRGQKANLDLHALGQNEGPYVNRPVNGIQQWHDFAGPRQFRTISFLEALKGPLSDADVKGAIVLVGIDAESFKDHFDTPLNSNPPEPGVSIHARAVEQLLRAANGQAMTQFWTRPRESSWFLAWGVLGALLGYVTRSPRFFAVEVFLGIVAIVFFVYLEACRMVWVPVVPPLLCWVGSAMFVTSYVSHQEKADRTVLMQLFAKHVSTQVADTIWDRREEFIRGGQLVPRTQEATVLFTDLCDFTAISERLDPAVLMGLVNEYMGRMSGCVGEHGGVVNKYIGDSIMAVFGVPIPSTTPEQIAGDAIRAVQSALAMRRELANLNEQWKARDVAPVRMRVGIHTGRLVAGSLGGVQRLEYTVLGDTVNTASRLESYDKEVMDADIAAEGCRILIGPRTTELVGNAFLTRTLGPIILKGKKGSIGVHGVIAATERNVS